MQPVLVVGLESVCRPADVTIGPDQQRAGLELDGRTSHHVDAVGPAARGIAHLSPGQVE
jgi:hypothetical protein